MCDGTCMFGARHVQGRTHKELPRTSLRSKERWVVAIRDLYWPETDLTRVPASFFVASTHHVVRDPAVVPLFTITNVACNQRHKYLLQGLWRGSHPCKKITGDAKDALDTTAISLQRKYRRTVTLSLEGAFIHALSWHPHIDPFQSYRIWVQASLRHFLIWRNWKMGSFYLPAWQNM